MHLKRIIAVVLTGIMLIVGACGGAKPTPPVTTPPVTTPPVTTPPVTTPPVTTPPLTTPPVVVPPPPTATQGPNEVWAAGGNAFIPGILTVQVGTTVVWKNKDSQGHTVVSNTGLFYGTLEPSGSFNFTFTKAGNYEYNCDIHAGMAGAIHVQ